MGWFLDDFRTVLEAKVATNTDQNRGRNCAVQGAVRGVSGLFWALNWSCEWGVFCATLGLYLRLILRCFRAVNGGWNSAMEGCEKGLRREGCW